METPIAPLSSIRRTVASVMNHVQAKEWMPPLSREDREAHQKACDQLHKEQEDESIIPDHHLQYGEIDPLPLDSWQPSVFKEEQGLTMYSSSRRPLGPFLKEAPLCYSIVGKSASPDFRTRFYIQNNRGGNAKKHGSAFPHNAQA